MQRTTLYEVTQKEVMTVSYVDYIAMPHIYNYPTRFVESTGDAVIPLLFNYEMAHLPIKQLYKDGNSLLYAFSPDLQEIVNCLIREAVEEYRDKGFKDFHWQEGRAEGVLETKKSFSELSLFQRIKKAFKGEL